MEKLTFNDVVKKEYDSKTKERRVFFPTLCVCSGCGGYSSIFHGGKSHKDPDLALQVALVQFGYSTIKHYDNSPPSHKCNCEERLEELKAVKFPEILEDTKWVLNKATSIPRRGISDYSRRVKFERDLTTDESNSFTELLRRDNCPGWTGVGCSYCGEGVYVFTTTWDSSD